jgi:hypothetical protein
VTYITNRLWISRSGTGMDSYAIEGSLQDEGFVRAAGIVGAANP